MEDKDYLTLRRIEREMRNEISALSMSNSRFVEYLAMMEKSTMGVNGVLKALDILKGMEQRSGRQESEQACQSVQQSLLYASQHKQWQSLFVNIDFSLPVDEEFASLEEDMPKQGRPLVNKSWLFVLGAAACSGLLMALLVLVFKTNYYLALILCLLFLGALLMWFYRIEIYRIAAIQLKKSMNAAQGEASGFLTHLAIARYPFPVWKLLGSRK